MKFEKGSFEKGTLADVFSREEKDAMTGTEKMLAVLVQALVDVNKPRPTVIYEGPKK